MASTALTHARNYLDLTKPRLLPMVLFTGLPVMGMASGGWPPFGFAVLVLFGIALAACSANALNAYLATMNMGTLTGAPKIEAMKIIRQLEKTKRGYYGGAVMYLTVDGQFDSCITIRSVQMRDGTAYIRVGAGIVHDSVPQTEFEETEHKAGSCMRALRGA